MTLYMAVTADKYELPVVVEDSPGNLEKSLGKNKRYIIEEMSRQVHRKGKRNTGKHTGYLLTKVEVDESD